MILGSRPNPIRLLRMTASLGAEEPGNLGHVFIMPVSLVTELPQAEYKLPLIASLWHLAEYLVQAGTETGHNSLRDFIVVNDAGYAGIVNGRVAEKIVHVADDMTFTSMPRRLDDKPVTLFFE